MRIVIISSLYTPHVVGGAEISTQILAEALAAAADVHVLTLGDWPRKGGVRREQIGGVAVHRLPHGNVGWIGDMRRRGAVPRAVRRLVDQYNPWLIATVRKLLDDIRPDLVHTQNLSGFGAAVWTAADSSGAPIVHTLRDYSLLSPVSSLMKNELLSRLYSLGPAKFSRRVAAVVGISSHILRRHTDAGLFPHAERLVIANAVEGAIAAPPRSWERRPLTIGCFGRIEAEKGVRELVDAAITLPDDTVGKVVICGEGSLKRQLEEMCRHDRRFVFPGKVSPAEARRLMAESDVNIVPSIWEEPFGRVIIESYQTGTPVLASNTGGIPDAVWNPGEYLFQPGNAREIRDKIIFFHGKTGEERMHIQEACLDHCRKFTQAAQLERHLELYARTLHGGAQPAAAAAYGQVR